MVGDKMNYSLAPSEDGKYIILTVRGEINRKIALQRNLEAHALGRKLGVNRYLVDVTAAKNTDTVKDSYDFAYTDMHITLWRRSPDACSGYQTLRHVGVPGG